MGKIRKLEDFTRDELLEFCIELLRSSADVQGCYGEEKLFAKRCYNVVWGEQTEED